MRGEGEGDGARRADNEQIRRNEGGIGYKIKPRAETCDSLLLICMPS